MLIFRHTRPPITEFRLGSGATALGSVSQGFIGLKLSLTLDYWPFLEGIAQQLLYSVSRSQSYFEPFAAIHRTYTGAGI
jgi:hypothetical protein